MIYGVMLEGWDAWLLVFDGGEGWRYARERRLQYHGEDEHKPSLGDAAEALWLEGAHPESLLMVLHASNLGVHDKITILGTAVLAMACGIMRMDEHGMGPAPTYFSEHDAGDVSG